MKLMNDNVELVSRHCDILIHWNFLVLLIIMWLLFQSIIIGKFVTISEHNYW